MKLFRLKSNPSTIVKIEGEWERVVWTKSMEAGFSDCSWMVVISNVDNLIPLTDEETKDVLNKRSKYLSRRPFSV